MGTISIRIGTRGSELAMVQSETVATALQSLDPAVVVTLEKIVTTGDANQRLGAAKPRDKKEWVREIEDALVRGDIDLAVHSGKDVPVDIAAGTVVSSILVREDPRDVFVPQRGTTFTTLSQGAIVGTSSARRKAELLRAKNDLKVVPFGGNVPTRLEKLASSSEVSGIVLAAAGLLRLGAMPEHVEWLPVEEFVPAVSQGILTVQYLAERADVAAYIAKLCDATTQACFLAERTCVLVLGADCCSAVGVHATPTKGGLQLRARVLSEDGSEYLEEVGTGVVATAAAVGEQVANALLIRGAASLL